MMSECLLIGRAIVSGGEWLEQVKTTRVGLRRADMLTAAAVLAAERASVLIDNDEGFDFSGCGIFVGLGTGPLNQNFEFLESVRANGEGQGSPTLFAHSVHNTLGGYISRLLGITGPCFTMTSFVWPFLSALQEAFWFIRSGRLKSALVISAEETAPMLECAKSGIDRHKRICSAIAWCLSGVSGHDRRIALIEDVSVAERPCLGEQLFFRSGERWSYPETAGANDGINDYAMALNQFISGVVDGVCDSRSWRLSGPFGNAVVRLRDLQCR